MSTPSRGDSGPQPTTVKYPFTFPVVERDEPEERFPATKEHIAVHIGQERPCVTVAQTHYPEALYNSVRNLVFKLAAKYQVTCPRSEAEDMAQDCWVRIVKKLHTYKPKWRFTTWVYKVCSSVLNKNYQRSRRRAAYFAEMPEGLDDERSFEEDDGGVGLRDFRDSIDLKGIIRELKELHPERAEMVDAIFQHESGVLNSDIVYRRAASRCGSTASKVSRFFREEVRPFFIERLGEQLNV